MGAPIGFTMCHTGLCQSNPGTGGVYETDYYYRFGISKVVFLYSLCRRRWRACLGITV